MEGTHFRRQATIGRYFADFACHQCKLVIELDGGGHAEPDQAMRDERRNGFLASKGYRVLRFWNDDVLRNTEGVMLTIRKTLNELCGGPPLTPPRHSLRSRGEGNGPQKV
jgi:very-short-patch-repair endonuclease